MDTEKAGLHSARDWQLWVGTVSLGYDGSGKRKRRKVYGQTKQEQGKLRAIQNKVDSRSLTDSTKLTVGEYLTRWLENTARNKVRTTTLERYDALIRRLIPTIGENWPTSDGWTSKIAIPRWNATAKARGLARWLVRYSATPSVPL